MDLTEKIAQLLIQGYPPGQVANAVACSPSFVSQLLSNEEFAMRVANERLSLTMEKHQQYTDIDNNYDNIEDQLLKKLGTLLPYINKPSEILATLRQVNSAVRKSSRPLATGQDQQSNVVSLTLPAHMLKSMQVAIKLDDSAQIVEVAGKSMATLPSLALHERLPELRELASAELERSKDKELATLLENINIPGGSLMKGISHDSSSTSIERVA